MKKAISAFLVSNFMKKEGELSVDEQSSNRQGIHLIRG